MKNRLKNLSVKKRYLFGAILAVELASIPAAAQMIDRVIFEVRPIVTAVEIPTEAPGKSRFLVVSNAPFHVSTENMIGDVSLSLHKSGNINGNRFGDNAQMPGEKRRCASVSSSAPTVIYQADHKTAAEPGPTASQAVVVVVNYDPVSQPDIEFIAGKSEQNLAPACKSINS